MLKINKKTKKVNGNTGYNIFIIDKSLIFALGLKNSLEESLRAENINSIAIKSNILDLSVIDLLKVDILFVDDQDFKNPLVKDYYAKIKEYKPDLKIIITVYRLFDMDFFGVFSFDISGMFSKGIDKNSFKNYIIKVMKLGFFIDFKMNGKIILKEKEQMKSYNDKFTSILEPV